MVVVLGNVQSVSMYGGVGGFDRLQSGFQGSCFERLHFQVLEGERRILVTATHARYATTLDGEA